MSNTLLSGSFVFIAASTAAFRVNIIIRSIGDALMYSIPFFDSNVGAFFSPHTSWSDETIASWRVTAAP